MKTYLVTATVLIACALGIWMIERNDAREATVSEEASQAETAEAAGNEPAAKPQPTKRPTAVPATPAPAPSESSEPKITYVNTSEDDIFIVLPRPGDEVETNVIISGAARGNWFQQGTFTAEVVASNGDTLVQNQIPAKGNYMTSELVQFSSAVFITSKYRGPATLILRNDNPPSHPIPDRSVSIPFVIK